MWMIGLLLFFFMNFELDIVFFDQNNNYLESYICRNSYVCG
jgi:hypothetical protein